MVAPFIWMAGWFGLGVVGLVTGNDPVFIVGLVNSTAWIVGIEVMRKVNKKENK